MLDLNNPGNKIVYNTHKLCDPWRNHVTCISKMRNCTE